LTYAGTAPITAISPGIFDAPGFVESDCWTAHAAVRRGEQHGQKGLPPNPTDEIAYYAHEIKGRERANPLSSMLMPCSGAGTTREKLVSHAGT
jgi:hypothetical protein